MQTINFCFGSAALSFSLNLAKIRAFYALYESFGTIFGVGSGSIFLPTYVNYQLWFWKCSPIFLFYSGTFGASFALFWALQGYFLPFGAIFGVQVRFKNIFGAYLCRKLSLVFEVEPDLFVFNSPKFWAILNFWGLSELFSGLGSGSKTFY